MNSIIRAHRLEEEYINGHYIMFNWTVEMHMRISKFELYITCNQANVLQTYV